MSARSPCPWRLAHTGWSGLSVRVDGATIHIDPYDPPDAPAIITWSEQERLRGIRAAPPRHTICAAPEVLARLDLPGIALIPGHPVEAGGFRIEARPFAPIPWATPAEAIRKLRSAARDPSLAIRRMRHTLRRPGDAPLMIRLDRAGARITLLSQALHRFLPPDALPDIAAWVGAAPLPRWSAVVAGTDWDDEAATGHLLSAFPADIRVIADLTGPIRQHLGLPVRPLSAALAAAPPGTVALRPGEMIQAGQTGA